MSHRHTTRQTNRLLASVAVIAVVAPLATACSDASEGAGGNIARVGLVCGGMTPMAAQVAINQETFPDDVEVEKYCFDSGADAVKALVGGSLDIFMGSIEHVLKTRAQDLPVKAYAGINNRAPYALVTAAGSDVQSVADLDGENVGVTSTGSLSDTELHQAAGEAGVDYDDLKVVDLGSGSSMAGGISQERVAAGMVSDPQKSQLVASGDYRLVWEPSTDYAAIVAVANTEWVENNESEMKAFLAGLGEAAERTTEDPTFAVEALQEEDFGVDDAVLTDAVSSSTETIPDGLVVTQEVYDETTAVLVDAGVVEEGDVLPYDEVFDFDLLESDA
ncbi:ABC transporter substrate-binding protein [Nocardioides marinquilinus]|uniref:ABC transporter substrate-binding protein n=1 Tax=Nocardioides marinquilinus TaxID=1210400 RepID=A0ABP9PCF0_9ACTN